MRALDLLRELVEALEAEVYPTFTSEAAAWVFISAKAGMPIGHSIAVKEAVVRAKQLLGSPASFEELFGRMWR
jgi:hypothetical protein